MTRPIVLIHGFGGGPHEYRPIVFYLKKHGSGKCYQFSYKNKFGKVSLREIAKELHDYIETHIAESEIDLIGLSQGGIIARLYIQELAKKNVKKCVTVCTPHHGSLLAYIGIFPGIKDLQPHSPLLESLSYLFFSTMLRCRQD